ncbi:uncharacterized protein C1orf112-like [Dendronephthya gigantea]|uniref:uncharacterized protein C1orf112-like n=1 Tax=Dendronephthya gigantea TaxID=151771 RepID=UPI00106A1536|nr:uncharacterized protein C1orf112-like [Dendronephthya gigantea]
MATTPITIPPEWRHQERDLEEVIPKAITLFHETSEHQEKIDVFSFLCHGLLPKLSLTTLEETLLRHVFSDLFCCIEKIFLEIEDIIQLKDEQNTIANRSQLLHDLLWVVITVLECIEACVQHISKTFQCIRIHEIDSLPVPVLMIIKSTFMHCQKSEASYGKLFSHFSEDLSQLFRKSFELQKLLLDLICVKIEALNTSSSEKDLQNIISVCDNLLDICEITERFDGNMTLGMWKSLMRLVMKNKEVIKNHLQSDRFVSQMCATIKVRLQSFENLTDSKDNAEADLTNESSSLKFLKILKFLFKLLINFVQSFQDFLLATAFKDIIELIFLVIKQSSRTLSSEDTRTSLMIVIESFLKVVVLNKKFADLLTKVHQEIVSKDNFPRCYTLANVAVLLPLVPEEVSSYWIKPTNYTEEEPRISIFEALLNSCDACFVEMSLPVLLPGMMCNGKAQRMVSLYEYVVSRLSASISAISSQHFHIIENILLRSVLHHSTIRSSIATDVWCFISRWMTADLCYNHVKLFLHWLSSVSWTCNKQKNKMCTLVRRLLPLVAQEHQELLVYEYPPDCFDNLEIWSVVPVHKMIESVRTQVTQATVHVSISFFQEWLKKKNSQPELEKTLNCLQNVLTHPIVFDCFSEDLKSDLIIIIICLFDAFINTPKQISDFCWTSFVDIFISVVPLISGQDFTKVLHNLAKAVNLHKDDYLNVYFARLMAECGKLTFAIGQNESTSIAKIFRALISSNLWLVHNEAFTALKRFAEVTPYTPVLEECVPDEMKEDFQKFICSIPYSRCEADDLDAMIVQKLKEQTTPLGPVAKIGDTEQNIKVVANCSSPEIWPSNSDNKELEKRKREVTDDESDAKRTKVESLQTSKEDEETLTSTLEELSKHLITLQEIHSRNLHLPPEVCEKLKSMKALLETMVKSI